MLKRRYLLLPALSLLVAGLISFYQPLSLAGSAHTSAQSPANPSLSAPVPSQAPVASPVQPPVAPLPSPTPASPALSNDLTQLFSRVWRVSGTSVNSSASNTIYIFLPNGTLLQTSCVETYAIFPWTIDKATPKVIQVSENGRPTYTAEILELSDTTLRLKKTLIRSNETEEVTLTAVQDEFICPDLPK